MSFSEMHACQQTVAVLCSCLAICLGINCPGVDESERVYAVRSPHRVLS